MTGQRHDFERRSLEWARSEHGDGVQIADFAPMPGNSGLSFGFDVRTESAALLGSYVVRMAPPGVRRSGNTDVLRQVPLLTALGRTDVPIARLVWDGDHSSCFGTDTIIQERLAGHSFNMNDPHGPLDPGRTVLDYVEGAVATLAKVHAVDWSSLLPQWSAPVELEQDLDYWHRLLVKADDSALIELGDRLREVLTRTAPEDDHVGLFHGDFHTNNVLYDAHGEVIAVVDWEIAGIGRTGLDVGWLSMMMDKSFWAPPYQSRMRADVEPQLVRQWYEEYAGRELIHFDWYRAYSGFRFGSIAAYNLRLHRTGKRPDPLYETMSSSIPLLFSRGTEQLVTQE